MKQAGTDAVFRKLVEAARDMRTVTYEELAKEAKIIPLSVGARVEYIRDVFCRPRGLPWLSVIAVSKRTGRPGDKFLPDGMSINESEIEVWWRAMVLQVYATDWSRIAWTDD